MPRKTMTCVALLFLAMSSVTVHAQNSAAVTSGNWNASSTWTGGDIPGYPFDAIIGGFLDPQGGTPVATVTLTQNQSIGYLTLGLGIGDSEPVKKLGNWMVGDVRKNY